jgi:hypothetical protein
MKIKTIHLIHGWWIKTKEESKIFLFAWDRVFEELKSEDKRGVGRLLGWVTLGLIAFNEREREIEV